jgi:hypothetical protein
MEVVAEQRRMLQETKVDDARLGERDANKEDYFMQASPSVFVDPQIQFAVNLVRPNRALQVADQSGKFLDLPEAAERSALIIAMSLHEKGRAALKRRDYPAALVLLLEADIEFSACSSDLLRMVDNYGILSLDIAWCRWRRWARWRRRAGAGAPGAWGLTGLISQPHLLEQGLAGVAARWHRWEGLLLYSVFVFSPLGNRPKMAKNQPKTPKKYQKSPKNSQKLPTCQPFLPHQQ